MPRLPSNRDSHRRPNQAPADRVLPVEGRPGRAPAWPLPGPKLPGEADLWRDVWKLPQAIVWAEVRCERQVARWVRLAVQAEQPGAKAALLNEVRQLEDRLGIGPVAMTRLRWTIGTPPAAGQPTPSTASSARARLRIVDDQPTGA